MTGCGLLFKMTLTPGLRTYINLYNNSVTACVGAAGTGGAGLGVGNAWWWYERRTLT